MKKQRSVETSEDLVRAFAELFAEVEPETPEETDIVLLEAGYDPAEIAIRMGTIAAQALTKSPLNWRSRARQELEEERTRFERLVPAPPGNRENIISAIQQLLSQLGDRVMPAYAHFRNFESATDEDLASLLSELEYLASQQGGRRERDEN